MNYSTKLESPQYIGSFKVDPHGGAISERQWIAVQHDPYGKDLIKKGWFVITPTPAHITEKRKVENAPVRSSVSIERK
ncbi:hypothetical protein FACS1894172_14890 [Spirochaetia bacterium]|nr:hypothetical protein FACS1894172_14890 [Spirochaetia bacterium]